MMARGGFGCARILDDLDWGLLQRRALPIVGYSDVTALHLGALRAGATTGISGPMVAIELGGPLISAQHLNALALTLQSFADVWTPGRAVCLPPGTALTPLRPGSAVGPIVPANLSVLVSLLGTRHMPRLRDAILVLEDTHEAAYRIDRYLTQLRQAGVLAQLAGLLFGSFSEGEDAEWLPAIMAEFAARVPGPVASGLPLGHCSPSLAAPVGRTGRLVCTNEHVEQLYW
jgi:muramoyltetrapeptide carboxypeptidase